MNTLTDSFELCPNPFKCPEPETVSQASRWQAEILDITTIERAYDMGDGTVFIGRRKSMADSPLIDISDDQMCVNGSVLDELEPQEITLLNSLIANAGRRLSRAQIMESGFNGRAVDLLQAMRGLTGKMACGNVNPTEKPVIEVKGDNSQRTYRIDAVRVTDSRSIKTPSLQPEDAEEITVPTAGYEAGEVLDSVMELGPNSKNILLLLLSHEQEYAGDRVLQRVLLNEFLAGEELNDFEKEHAFFKALDDLRATLLEVDSPCVIKDASMYGQRAFLLEVGEFGFDGVVENLIANNLLEYGDMARFLGIEPTIYEEAIKAMQGMETGKGLKGLGMDALVNYIQKVDILEMKGSLPKGDVQKHFVDLAKQAFQSLLRARRRTIREYAAKFAGSSRARFDELIFEGQIGLLDAIRLWDDSLDSGRFSSYSDHRIRGSMLDFLRKESVASHKVTRQVGALKRRLYDSENYDEHGNSIYDRGEWQKLQAMDMQMTHVSLDELVDEEDDLGGRDRYNFYDDSESGDPVVDDVIDNFARVELSFDSDEDIENSKEVLEAYDAIEEYVYELADERLKLMLAMRFGMVNLLNESAKQWRKLHKHRLTEWGGLTLDDIGDYFGVTESRIAQITRKQMDKLGRSRKIRWALEGRT